MLFFVIGLFEFSLLVNAQHVILNSSQGQLKGTIEKSRAGRQFFAFYGIPYAEPPVGDLRFENPVRSKPWKGIKDCTSLPPACLSYEGEIYGHEDCLYLNLYTPKLISDSPLPVIVFVYGGRYMFGNALPSRYGPHYFMDRDVILITFHYRLGVLGFLSTADETLPGNYGLKDFAAVLKWVQDNVHSFNGDKNKVTIAGGSSGGITTIHALMSPLTRGLFHRCISQSVPPDSILSATVVRKRTRQVAKNVGCEGDFEEIVSCLKRVPATTLIKENFAFDRRNSCNPLYPFGPVIEDEKSPEAFLVDTAEKMFPRNTDIPLIISINSDEGGMGAIFNYFNFGIGAPPHELAANYDKCFPLLFDVTSDSTEAFKYKEVADLLKEHFFGHADIETSPIEYSKMMNHLYLPPLRKYLQLHRGPKYVYYYAHRNKESFSKSYGDPPPELDFGEYFHIQGVIHGDELISMFNWSETITPVTSGYDFIVSEQMLELWTNFATFG